MVLNEFENIEKNPWWNVIKLQETIAINEWHSFCLSVNVDLRNMSIIQNGNIIAQKSFEILHNDIDSRLKRLMPYAYMGGNSGSIADAQIFSRSLTYEEMKKWTLCQGDEKVFFTISFLQTLFSHQIDILVR